MLRHHGKEGLVEILHPSARRGTRRLRRTIEKGRKPGIVKRQRRAKAKEEMEKIWRRSHSRNNG